MLTNILGVVPNHSQAKKKKQEITVTNKMTKGVLVIQKKKEITVKAKIARKKSFNKEDKEGIQIQVF